jgi:hypothetical protein
MYSLLNAIYNGIYFMYKSHNVSEIIQPFGFVSLQFFSGLKGKAHRKAAFYFINKQAYPLGKCDVHHTLLID